MVASVPTVTPPTARDPADITAYLDDTIEEVSVGGESGNDARPCRYEWVTDIRRQCVEKNVPFFFHQTGARFVKDGKCYQIPRKMQHSQAHRAGLDYRIGKKQSVNLSAEAELTLEDFL